MPSILFVCTANQFRSPLAAACLLSWLDRQNMRTGWVVESAGTWTKEGLSALLLAQQSAKRLGLQGLASHRSRQVSAELLKQYDLIIVMEAGHKEALNAEFRSVRSHIFMLSEVVENIQYDIPDPVLLAAPADGVGVATKLYSLINNGADRILDLARTLSSARKDS
jgi:protein-tyrosine phosphatase